MRGVYVREKKEQNNLEIKKRTRGRPKKNLENLTTSTKENKKDSAYFTGICAIIKACGENGVLECHFGDVSLFRTDSGNFYKYANRDPLKIEQNEVENKTPRTADEYLKDPEVKAVREVQKQILDDGIANIDLEDPIEAEKLILDLVEKESKGKIRARPSVFGDEEEDI